MVSTILTAFALFIMVLCVYVLYERWDYEQKQKKTRKRYPKAMKKAEYDCTENYYHD